MLISDGAGLKHSLVVHLLVISYHFHLMFSHFRVYPTWLWPPPLLLYGKLTWKLVKKNCLEGGSEDPLPFLLLLFHIRGGWIWYLPLSGFIKQWWCYWIFFFFHNEKSSSQQRTAQNSMDNQPSLYLFAFVCAWFEPVICVWPTHQVLCSYNQAKSLEPTLECIKIMV